MKKEEALMRSLSPEKRLERQAMLLQEQALK
jgi:hypothetical protein